MDQENSDNKKQNEKLQKKYDKLNTRVKEYLPALKQLHTLTSTRYILLLGQIPFSIQESLAKLLFNDNPQRKSDFTDLDCDIDEMITFARENKIDENNIWMRYLIENQDNIDICFTDLKDKRIPEAHPNLSLYMQDLQLALDDRYNMNTKENSELKNNIEGLISFLSEMFDSIAREEKEHRLRKKKRIS